MLRIVTSFYSVFVTSFRQISLFTKLEFLSQTMSLPLICVMANLKKNLQYFVSLIYPPLESCKARYMCTRGQLL